MIQTGWLISHANGLYLATKIGEMPTQRLFADSYDLIVIAIANAGGKESVRK